MPRRESRLRLNPSVYVWKCALSSPPPSPSIHLTSPSACVTAAYCRRYRNHNVKFFDPLRARARYTSVSLRRHALRPFLSKEGFQGRSLDNFEISRFRSGRSRQTGGSGIGKFSFRSFFPYQRFALTRP